MVSVAASIGTDQYEDNLSPEELAAQALREVQTRPVEWSSSVNWDWNDDGRAANAGEGLPTILGARDVDGNLISLDSLKRSGGHERLKTKIGLMDIPEETQVEARGDEEEEEEAPASMDEVALQKQVSTETLYPTCLVVSH